MILSVLFNGSHLGVVPDPKAEFIPTQSFNAV